MKTRLKNIAKRILSTSGYSVRKTATGNHVIMPNVFNTAHDKNALLIHSVFPLDTIHDKGHTYKLECYTIAKTFRRLDIT